MRTGPSTSEIYCFIKRRVRGIGRGDGIELPAGKKYQGLYGNRTSFDALAQRVFGLSFEQWYRDGYWTDRYKPYVLLDGGTVVASIAVNRMQTMWRGKGRSYIQLGTVMTDPQYRKQGLSRCLMEQVLRDYCRSCDAVYLFANDSALDFYPRFGFERAVEYQFSCPVTPNPKPPKGWIWKTRRIGRCCNAVTGGQTLFPGCRCWIMRAC